MLTIIVSPLPVWIYAPFSIPHLWPLDHEESPSCPFLSVLKTDAIVRRPVSKDHTSDLLTVRIASDTAGEGQQSVACRDRSLSPVHLAATMFEARTARGLSLSCNSS